MTAILERQEIGVSQPRANGSWLPRIILGTSMFLTGAAGLVYEYVLSTVNTYLLGNSIEQFSVVIGAMFLMMGIGGFLQKLIRGAFVEWFVAVQLVLVILGGFAPIIMQWMFAFQPDTFGTFRWVYVCLIGLLIGMEAPIAMRINERFAGSLGSNIANTWGMDYAGGAVGVIAWLMLLRHHMPLTHISFIVASANLTVAIITLIFFWKRGMMRWRLSGPIATILSVSVVIATIVGWTNVGEWSKITIQKMYEDPIVFTATTPYQQIVITEGPHPTDIYGHNYELFLNGNKQFSSVDEAIYHELLIHPAMNAAASHRNVLVLGGGDGLAMREILKYPDVQNVTLVDLDPEMIEISKTNPILTSLNHNSFGDARVHIQVSRGVTDTGEKEEVFKQTNDPEETTCSEVVEPDGTRQSTCVNKPKLESLGKVDIYTIDADRFIADKSGPYDVVVVDLPDPNSIELAKLYSLEFYQKIKRNMSPDGTIVVQSTSPYHSKETFLCILRTMSAAGFNVVPYHDNVPSFGDWGWVMGSPTLHEQDLHDRLDTMSSFNVPTREIDPSVLKRALIFNKGWLTSNNNTISTLTEPVVYQYYEYEGWKIE